MVSRVVKQKPDSSEQEAWAISDLRPGDLIRALPIAMAIFRRVPEGEPVISFANAAFEALGGSGRHQLLGLTPDKFSGIPSSANLAGHVRTAFQTGEPVRIDIAPQSLATGRFYAWTLFPISTGRQVVDHVFATVLDTTPEKQAVRQLIHAAYHDELTGLPNRILFLDKLEQAMNRPSNVRQTQVAVLSLNLDRFQHVNESLGHSAGDQLLTGLARRLINALRAGDTLARLSGDEFVVLVDGIVTLDEALVVAGRIHRELQAPFLIGELQLHMTISIGIASTIETVRHPEDLIRDADFAMHRAKMLGKARTEVYHPELHGRARNLFQLEGELRRAVFEDQLVLHYQPIFDLSNGRLAGFEALARWPHVKRGMVSPGEFIPIAEETGLIVPLGRWALRAACAQLRAWRDRFGNAAAFLTMAVNVSSIQFARDTLVDTVTEALVASGLPGSVLTLELTESAIVENPEHTRSVLQQLKALDVEIAIDDFGTGYSSLAHLQRFPIDKIKLDRTFIAQMAESAANRKLTSAVLMLARSLDKQVVAEGIETHEQHQLLTGYGCEFGQGYHFSRPLDLAQAESYLASVIAPAVIEGDVETHS